MISIFRHRRFRVNEIILHPILVLIGSLLHLAVPSHAQITTWKSHDDQSEFRGTYMSHDDRHVTIRRTDGRVFTFAIEKLHADHQSWLKKQQRDTLESTPENANAIFDELVFGDTRREVEAKLKASKIVEMAVAETLLGRFGLNGTFRTIHKIGGLHCLLDFGWSTQGKLNEISLRTEPLGATAYESRLKNNWTDLAKLMTNLYGKPVQAADYPGRNDLQNDLMLGSHLWHLDGGGSAMLGSSMQNDQYMIIVRFTPQTIQPVRTP